MQVELAESECTVRIVLQVIATRGLVWRVPPYLDVQVDFHALRARKRVGIRSVEDVSYDCARATRCTVRQADPLGLCVLWGQRTHFHRAIVALILTLATWHTRHCAVVVITLPAQVVVQQARACATERARQPGESLLGTLCGARTGKDHEDLARFVGQACDVRRYPIRARGRHEQVAQQSHSEQRRHGRRLRVPRDASVLPALHKRNEAGT